ncbi:uncharacterized protein LOC117610472 [Osmia lignaria lignaria]|uniref:uncharacterized protein LOC117610472 n=1 Tax=Osmia lignaria lignaria TaxID=1437193 RepID=UPI00402B8699
MENSFSMIKDDDTDEKWSSFCSSCKFVLQSTHSVGVPSILDETIDELTIENLSTITEEINNFDQKRKVVSDAAEHGMALTKLNNLNNRSQKKMNCTIKNVSEYHRKILKITKSILYLSNCIDVMREIILQEIHKKQFVKKAESY